MMKMITKLLFLLSATAILSTNAIAEAAEEKNPEDALVKHIISRAHAFESPDELDRLIEQAKSRKLVLLGEASHGTSEYYKWRDIISRRLITEHGFNFIAVEGDWASLYELNRYVKDLPGAAKSAYEVLKGLDRWPQWMWANHEVVALAEWLREHNQHLPADERIGFYGKDVYDEWNSHQQLLSKLQQNSPELYKKLKAEYACFSPYGQDSWRYAQLVAQGASDCTANTARAVEIIRANRDSLQDLSDYQYFWLEQNALVIKHAEKFYRKSVSKRDASSWNSRVGYMNLTVNRLLALHGDQAKGIVWAHNTHIGDARFTSMTQHGQENIGQLSRMGHGQDNVMLVGFTTYKGTVKAGSQWGSERKKMQVPTAANNSIEAVLEQTGIPQFYLLFDEADRDNRLLMQARGNRAIGVVYNPQNDRRQYVPTLVPLRYDALFFFSNTEALSPLHNK